jgi:catechol 2,3-dioxygenase-like lactoylglutathione lyase family enzyme
LTAAIGVEPRSIHPMKQTVAHVTLLVEDYDQAIAYYTQVLGFELLEDRVLSEMKRWVVVRPQGGAGTTLLLAKASTAEQRARVGDQTGGRVAFFCRRMISRVISKG